MTEISMLWTAAAMVGFVAAGCSSSGTSTGDTGGTILVGGTTDVGGGGTTDVDSSTPVLQTITAACDACLASAKCDTAGVNPTTTCAADAACVTAYAAFVTCFQTAGSTTAALESCVQEAGSVPAAGDIVNCLGTPAPDGCETDCTVAGDGG